jgi:hypothetical protein
VKVGDLVRRLHNGNEKIGVIIFSFSIGPGARFIHVISADGVWDWDIGVCEVVSGSR